MENITYSKDNHFRLLTKALIFCFFGLSLIYLIGFLPNILAGTGLECVEGIIADYCSRMSDNSPLYQFKQSNNIVSVIYPPIYPWLVSSLANKNVILGGRLITLCAFIIEMSIIFAILKKSHVRTYILFFPLFLLANYTYFRWTFILRADQLALTLAIAGVSISFFKRTHYSILLSTLCFIASGFTKQSMIGIVIGWYAYLLIHESKNFLIAMVAGLSMLAAAMFIGHIMTDGEFAKQVIFMQSLCEFSWKQGLHILWQIVAAWWPLELISIFAIIVMRRNRQFQLLASLFLFSFTWFLFSIFKTGSSTNYAMEHIVIAILTSGLFVNQLSIRWQKLIISLLVLQLSFLLVLSAYQGYKFTNKVKAREAIEKTLIDNTPTGKEILTDQSMFDYLINKKCSWDAFGSRFLVAHGLWDQNPTLEKMTNGTIKYVLVEHDYLNENNPDNWIRLTREIVLKLKANYEYSSIIDKHLSQIATYFVYEYRDKHE